MKRNVILEVFYNPVTDDREQAIQRELNRLGVAKEQCKSIHCFPDTPYFRKQKPKINSKQLKLFPQETDLGSVVQGTGAGK